MSQFRRVTDHFSVSPQITPDEAAAAARDGFVLIINNRPDGEAPDQPGNAQVEAAARAAGADYVHIPVLGRPGPDQVRAMGEAMAKAGGGPVLAFCRSGTRSITTWALGRRAAGEDRDELVRLGAAAGYDLDSVLP